MTQTHRTHWNQVYRDKDAKAVSWFRPHLDVSLTLLDRSGLNPSSKLIDVGGGASSLVDDLLARGIANVTVMDLSDEALRVAQKRLGERAVDVAWLAADVTQVALPAHTFDYWHDRAVLHFLSEPRDVSAYVQLANHALRPGGHAVIGGFSPKGPTRCSGLDIVRRDAEDIAALFGADFELVAQAEEAHTTPSGATQHFAYALLRKHGGLEAP